MTKYIDGILFHFSFKSKRKKEAKQYAKSMRKKGHRARVIKEEKMWTVFRDKY